jgi:hypothetical protein
VTIALALAGLGFNADYLSAAVCGMHIGLGEAAERHHFPRILTVNVITLLATPLTVTTNFPGPSAAWPMPVLITVSLQLAMAVKGFPLNVTVLVPWVAPKPVPVIVIGVPVNPETGETLFIVGAAANSIPTTAVATTARTNR